MSHPTGNANVRQAALALKESNQLAEFWTCLAPDPDSAWMRLLPALSMSNFNAGPCLSNYAVLCIALPYAKYPASSLGS
jgi:hypothetical protein